MQRWNDQVLVKKPNGDINVGSNATITVYQAGTTTKAVIYSDEGISTKSNPFTTDSEGKYYFYAANGDYDVNISGTNINTYTLSDISLYDSSTVTDLNISTFNPRIVSGFTITTNVLNVTISSGTALLSTGYREIVGATFALSANTNNYIYVDPADFALKNTSVSAGHPNPNTDYFQIATIVTDAASVIASYTANINKPILIDRDIDGGLDPLYVLDSRKITTGPLAGAYLLAPGGYVNWYFASLALLNVVEERTTDVKNYLNLYIAQCNQGTYTTQARPWSINDFYFSSADTAFTTPIPRYSDSDDSYAATIIALAVKYIQISGDTAWASANLASIKNIAYYNIAQQTKNTTPGDPLNGPIAGLTATFQQNFESNRGAGTIGTAASSPSVPNWPVGYLMDNCEVYFALKLFVDYLTSIGDSDDTFYAAVRDGVANGIHTLYNSSQKAWLYWDDPNYSTVTIGNTYYPDATCQIFPEFFQVPTVPANITTQRQRYDYAYKALFDKAPQWYDGLYYDYFPWLILAANAVYRGAYDVAEKRLETVRQRYFSLGDGAVPIHDVGLYYCVEKRLRNTTNIIELNDANSTTPTITAVSDTATSLGLKIKTKGDATLTLDAAQIYLRGATTFGTSFGYGTVSGVGGTVTQTTSKSTGVTLNKICGQITTHNASLAASTTVGFTVTNSTVAATDVVIANIASGATNNSYQIMVTAVSSGSFRLEIRNTSAGSLSQALVINYAVVKGVNT